MTFRRATLEDLYAIVGLLADDELGCQRERPGDPAARMRYLVAFQEIDADANQLLAVADDAGIVVGCLQLTFIPGLSLVGMRRAQVEGVRVAASHRGQGVGAAFVHWAIDRAREAGCGLIQLTTDKSRGDAQQFYRSLGFVASHEGMKLKFDANA